MPSYVDQFGFAPLPAYLDEALASYLDSADGSGSFLIDGHPPKAKELEELGYLSGLSHYADFTASGTVTAKGLHYFDEKTAWCKRVEAWQASQDEAAQKSSRREWAMNAAGGAYAIVGAVLGGVIGYFLGKL